MAGGWMNSENKSFDEEEKKEECNIEYSFMPHKMKLFYNQQRK